MPNHYTTIAICSPGYDFDCKKFNKQHAKTCLCSAVMPMPENIKQADGGVFCDWGRENWGTKWGTYDTQAFDLDGDGSPVCIKFQSAWGPPEILDEIAEWLKRVGKFENVVWIGFDPCDYSTKLLAAAKGAGE